MSCVAEGNVQCTRCCEAIHVPGEYRKTIRRNKGDSPQFINKCWTPTTKRRAKKINPYMFSSSDSSKQFLTNALYFTCKALVGGACSQYANRPPVCQIYKGGKDYSPSCLQDINIIARG